MCPTLRSGTRCSLGDLNLLATVVASYTGANGQVPFYFDQTLGGADINGDDTLRGYADYRFRAPSSVLFQLEYRRVLWVLSACCLFMTPAKLHYCRLTLAWASCGTTSVLDSTCVPATMKWHGSTSHSEPGKEHK